MSWPCDSKAVGSLVDQKPQSNYLFSQYAASNYRNALDEDIKYSI